MVLLRWVEELYVKGEEGSYRPLPKGPTICHPTFKVVFPPQKRELLLKRLVGRVFLPVLLRLLYVAVVVTTGYDSALLARLLVLYLSFSPACRVVPILFVPLLGTECRKLPSTTVVPPV